MARPRRWTSQPAFVPAVFGLYLVLACAAPSHWYIVLLGSAIVTAATNWEMRGGLIAAGMAGPALLLGLSRSYGSALIEQPRLLEGYFWTYVAGITLAVFVGSITRSTRAQATATAELLTAQQRLSALHTIALSLTTTLDAERLMEKILEQLGKLWGYEFGAILLRDEETGDLVVEAARGYLLRPGERLPAGSGVSWEVLETGQPVMIADVTRDPRYVPGVEGARSELAVPLHWEGRILGILNVESRLPGAFSPADVTLLSTVAEHAAAALGNARLHQQTRTLALTDAHTGLYNYRHYQETVTELVREAQLTGQPFSLLMLDVDHFKRINDTYGHPTGDIVLEQFARALRDCCRQGDLCYRYGGEEFAVTLPGAPSDVAGRVAERIREKIGAHPFIIKSGRRLDLPVTVSIGVATYPRDGLTHVDLLLSADRALYTAKSGGRNRVVNGAAPAPKAQQEHSA